MTTNRFWYAWALALAAGSLAASCGGDGGSGLFEGEGGSGQDAAAGSNPDAAAGGSAGKGGTSGHGGSPASGGSSGQGGTSGSGAGGGCSSSCDDGIPCTLDACDQGACTHTPDSSKCSADYSCIPGAGCVLTADCSTDAQCTQKFGNDPCKADLRCDGGKCAWKPLDQDSDGIPGPSCGGTDCHDGDPMIHPGVQESCDGKDNDCVDGVDNGALCPGLLVCTYGQCACPQEKACSGECVDKSVNPNHCGACNNVCPWGATCVAGSCKCSGNTTACSGQCVDLSSSTSNCGGCGATCQSGQSCVSGKCTCPNNLPTCNGACPNYQNDSKNCGGCGVVCTGGKTCQSGVCACSPPQQQCTGVCVNTAVDPANCGGCGNKCGPSQPCVAGVCQNCTPGDLVILMDHSGSMSTALGSPTRWNAAQAGAKAFLADPASASLAVGLQFMPLPGGGTVTCSTNTDCTSLGDPFASCVNGVCQFLINPNADSCKAADYAAPAVALGVLSQAGQLAALNAAIDGQAADGGTPMTPALQGTLEYARSRAQATGHRTALVLLTDGVPNTCTGQDSTSAAAAVAQSFANGTPKIATYVVGIGTVGDQDWAPTDWNQIAVAGGTGAFRPATSQAEIQQQLTAIRNSFSVCQ